MGERYVDSRTGLHCADLTLTISGTLIIDSLNITFPTSGIVALIGPNGAGKTTLFNIISGLIRPDRGQCRLDDLDLIGLPPHEIARVGVSRTFQRVRLIRELTVMENILLSRRNQPRERALRAFFASDGEIHAAEEREFAKPWLRRFHLQDCASAAAATLSYGQQKSLAIACCAASECRLLLLDEPIAGLDFDTKREVVELLKGLRSANSLIIFVEHDLAAVREIADHVVVLDHGKAIAHGHPKDTLDCPAVLEAFVA